MVTDGTRSAISSGGGGGFDGLRLGGGDCHRACSLGRAFGQSLFSASVFAGVWTLTVRFMPKLSLGSDPRNVARPTWLGTARM